LGTGPPRDLGLPFSTIFAAGSIVALPLAVIASFVIRRLQLLGAAREDLMARSRACSHPLIRSRSSDEPQRHRADRRRSAHPTSDS
jgi:hypothetical protein